MKAEVYDALYDELEYLRSQRNAIRQSEYSQIRAGRLTDNFNRQHAIRKVLVAEGRHELPIGACAYCGEPIYRRSTYYRLGYDLEDVAHEACAPKPKQYGLERVEVHIGPEISRDPFCNKAPFQKAGLIFQWKAEGRMTSIEYGRIAKLTERLQRLGYTYTVEAEDGWEFIYYERSQ